MRTIGGINKTEAKAIPAKLGGRLPLQPGTKEKGKTMQKGPWTNSIEGCFGDLDRIFCSHYLDEERAFELLTRLRQERVRWREAEKEFRKWLAPTGQTNDHVEEQMAEVKKKFEPWIRD